MVVYCNNACKAEFVKLLTGTMQNLIRTGTQFIFLFVLFGALAISASAITFTVNSTANTGDSDTTDNRCDTDPAEGDQCTLRAAIQQANASPGPDAINFDTVIFASAQTILVSGSALPQITGELTITGTSSALLIIDGDASYRVFNVASGATVNISNLTVTNGFVGESSGGGILNSGNLTLTNVAVRNNEVSFGAGAGVSNTGSIQIVNSVIHDNMVSGNGGGIANSGTMTITNSEIYSNQANVSSGFGGNGGGILNDGTANVNNSIVRDNTASEAGAGIYTSGTGTLNLTNSTVLNNTMTIDGGGIFVVGGTVTLTRSTVSGNGANNGAGIYNTNGSVTLDTSTISGNVASNIGGGYYGFADLSTTSLSASASTIASNTAATGGGVAVSAGVGASTANLDNTIVGDNSASAGPDIFSSSGVISSGGYNLIENTSGGTFVSLPTDITGVDPGLLPLANNGGPTPTHALNSTSPAIDKGNSTGTDQRGVARPIDNPGIAPPLGGNNSDIGAFEASASPSAASVTIGGRVVSAAGKGIGNARVVLTEADGTTRQTVTNSFGYYRFADIAAGQTATLEVRSKRFGFLPQIINVNEEMSNLNFIAQP